MCALDVGGITKRQNAASGPVMVLEGGGSKMPHLQEADCEREDNNNKNMKTDIATVLC